MALVSNPVPFLIMERDQLPNDPEKFFGRKFSLGRPDEMGT